jgi:hypothetical protein
MDKSLRPGHRPSLHLIARSWTLTLGLDNRGFTLPNRRFAFPAAGEAKGENYRANDNEELFHGDTPRCEN